MSAKTLTKTTHQRTASGRSDSSSGVEQNADQPAMASATLLRSMETDAVPVPAPPRLNSGYRKEIFEKEEDRKKFSCGMCGMIVREPVQADCGHRFCQNCKASVEESAQQNIKVMCNFCKDEGLSDEDSFLDPKEMFPDRGFKREMMKIHTKCPNESCTWQGSFKEYVGHEGECQHQPLVCEKCGEYVSKHRMEQHKSRICPQRVVKCDHCHIDIIFDQKKVHLKECPKVPVSCNQCNKDIPRDKMKKHQSQDCPSRMVSCPLEGCSGPQQQSRFPQHVQKDQPKHLAWVLSRIADLDEAVGALTDSAPTSQASSAGAGRRGSEARESVDGLKTRLEQLERQLQDYVRQSGASAAAGGATSGGRGDMGQASGGAENFPSSGSTADRVNTMEFKVNSLEPVLSVLHGEMNRCIGAIEALEAKLMRETRAAEEFRRKTEQYETTISTFSATLAQREAKVRELEARLVSLGQDLPDGTMLWRIPCFSQVRKDAVAGTVTNIHSRPFYSGPLGYKMCVRLYPNGDGMGKGTHLSLFFSIMRSPHDALLPWPFKQKVYFMLIDQTFKKHIVDAFRSEPSSSSFQKPTSESNIATGCPLFVELSKLTQAGHGYVKDDTMYIRVVVETDGLDEHLKQFDPRTMPPQQS